MAAYPEVLGEKLSTKQRAMLRLALSFFTWRTLVRDGGLKQAPPWRRWFKPSTAQNEIFKRL